MTQQPAPERQPVPPAAAEALRAYAAEQRDKADRLAAVLEDIAANGLPDPETGVLWETLRDAHLARLAEEPPRVA
ncbi:hypothetical protein ACFP1Z_09945 [Streptomyces gamaensis]|uniref:CopG family transcriptional regulator n=1 Tax=Streptomyces gamaensis TaxID=1763542 RepID=A0ABW0YYH9_9ACTN